MGGQSSGKIIIQVDPDLEDIIPIFLENRQKDIAKMKESISTRNFEVIQTLGHGMKGAGSGYGFDGVTEIGRLIEAAAKEKNLEAVEQQLAALIDYLERVELVKE